jgi:membrane-associated phospholipid phosphatase
MLVSIFDLIGHYGPVISFALTFYNIIHQIPYLTAFVFGSILNVILNMYLKTTIREPRPENQIEYIDYNETYNDLTGFNEFGMPSGHAQTVMFAVVFLFLVKGPSAFTYAILFIAGLTIYQRWKYNRHTVRQLIIGSVVGGLVAALVFHATHIYLHGNAL